MDFQIIIKEIEGMIVYKKNKVTQVLAKRESENQKAIELGI